MERDRPSLRDRFQRNGPVSGLREGVREVMVRMEGESSWLREERRVCCFWETSPLEA